MAIVIEENRNRVSLVTVATWIVILIIIIVAVYYLFVKNPDKIETALPSGFQNTQRVTQIYLDPKMVIQHPAFRSRKQYIPSPIPGIRGRENPFLPPFPTTLLLPPLSTSTASST